jgi:hypothetical protein
MHVPAHTVRAGPLEMMMLLKMNGITWQAMRLRNVPVRTHDAEKVPVGSELLTNLTR